MWSLLGGLLRGRSREAPPTLEKVKCGRPFAQVKVDVYLVRGEDSQEILSEASILLLPETLAFVGVLSDGVEKQAQPISFFGGKVGKHDALEFKYQVIERFRQHKPDMCQWAVDTDKGSELEFGLVFPDETSATSFNQQLVMRVCASAFVEIISGPCALEEYDRLAGVWRMIEPQAIAQIREKVNCSEAFLLVFNKPADSAAATTPSNSSSKSEERVRGARKESSDYTISNSKSSVALESAAAAAAAAGAAARAAAAAAASREGEAEAAEAAAEAAAAAAETLADDTLDVPLCYIRISYDEFIFPLPEQRSLQWWGSSPEGQKRLYRITFSDSSADSTATEAESQKQAKEDVGKRFLELYALTLAEVSSKCRLSTELDIDRQMGYTGDFVCHADESEREGMRIDDADSDPSDDEEQFPVVTRDPTRELLRSSPDTMINELLEAGTKRSVVFRVGGADTPGEKRDMQVLRFDEDGKHSVVASVDGSKLIHKGRQIEASAAMLHDCEERLVMLDESDRNSAYLLDLETQTVIRRLQTGGLEIRHVLPKTSAARETSEATFLGLNSRSFFCLDTRVKEGATRRQTYTYLQNQGLCCGATNDDGKIVLGSDKGVLRLYDGKTNDDGNFKRAKTQLSGFRDPILHVTVTSDGSWILATCARYLLLYPVRLSTTKRTGFVAPLGAMKPKPIVLRLSIEDVSKYNLQTCAFKKAEFDKNEHTIVTSTNNLVIVWDFVAVKNGKTDAYQIRRVSDFIKDLAFVSTTDKEAVVVVTPCSVTTRGVRRVYKDCESEPES